MVRVEESLTRVIKVLAKRTATLFQGLSKEDRVWLA